MAKARELSPWRFGAALRFVFVAIPWLLWLIILGVVVTLALPIKLLFPTFIYNASSKAADSVWSSARYIFVRLNGAKITVSGDLLPQGESAVVVANHLSWTDFYLVQELAVRAGMLSRCRYFAKKSLIWVPGLGLGLYALGCPLISRNWTQDEEELNQIFEGFTSHKWPVWLISYSEATRLKPEKFEQAVTFCKEHGKSPPEFTLHPRTKGFVSTVSHLRKSPHVSAVYDVTIAYAYKGKFLKPPTMVQSLLNPLANFRFHSHVDRFVMKDLPENEDELRTWLESRWVKKNETLKKLKAKLDKGEEWGSELD